MIKILIADDHPIVRTGLKEILEKQMDAQVVWLASNYAEVMTGIEEQDIDCVLLDISMPGKSGLDTLKQIKTMRKDLPVLIISTHPEDQYAMRSIRAGASGYFLKDRPVDQLVVAIRKVVAGGKYISESLAEDLAFQVTTNPQAVPLHKKLSDREYSVFIGLASGKSLTDLSEELSLSVKTVSTYRTRLLEKLDMENNAELVHYAISNKLIS